MLDWRAIVGDRDIKRGRQWPSRLAKATSRTLWPKQAFGTANAACLLIWHRPGIPNEDGVLNIEPGIPVLGGIPHPHNVLWPRYHPSPSWRNLHKYLPRAFSDLEEPWSQVMIACLNPEPGKTGSTDRTANMEAVKPGGRLDLIVSVCQPRAILLCGNQVQEAIGYWTPSIEADLIPTSHPLKWDGHGGQRDGPSVVAALQRSFGQTP